MGWSQIPSICPIIPSPEQLLFFPLSFRLTTTFSIQMSCFTLLIVKLRNWVNASLVCSRVRSSPHQRGFARVVCQYTIFWYQSIDKTTFLTLGGVDWQDWANWLIGQVHRVAVNGVTSDRWPVTCGVPQGLSDRWPVTFGVAQAHSYTCCFSSSS